jgi:ERF superfamily.
MNIFETVSAVMKDIGAIGKTSKNTTQGFMFRGIDAVMNAINPALVKYKLFIVPEVLEQTREERQTTKGGTLIYSIVKVKYTFYAEDGSSITATVIGEGMDSGDKATNKAMSIAFKYACFQVFCIPTEEMVDPDKESHEVTPAKISEKDAKILEELLIKKGVNVEKTMELYKVKSFTELTPTMYSDIIGKANGAKR